MMPRDRQSILRWATLRRAVAPAVLLAAVLGLAATPAGPARAQLQLPGQLGGALGALGGGVPSVGGASLGNIAGVLEYCVTNNVLGGGGAPSVAQSLIGKLGGAGAASHNADYAAGASGMLHPGNGPGVNLGGGGLMADLKQQICSAVLQRAQSLL